MSKKNTEDDVYTDQGYTHRQDYLESLADERGIDPQTIDVLADMLGPSEDFDGLVNALEDYQSMALI
jgi:hypothetical protein